MRKSAMENLLKGLLDKYMHSLPGILGVMVFDRNGLIITSISKVGEQGDDVLGVLSSLIDSYIERIKNEFGAQRSFCNITTLENKKLVYCSMGLNSILTTIAEPSSPDQELKVFSEYIARKIELILDGNENISLEIPEIVRVLSRTKDGVLPEGDFTIKLILTGDFQVGKTSLIKRFVDNEFQKNYINTIGVQISKKVVDIAEKTKVSFLIWDIGGQITQITPYRQKFYNGARAAFIVVDRTRNNAIKSIETWYKEIKNSIITKIPIVIVGNKSDLTEEIVVKEENIKKVAENYGFHYVLTSAKTGENVNDAFLYIAYRFLESA